MRFEEIIKSVLILSLTLFSEGVMYVNKIETKKNKF